MQLTKKVKYFITCCVFFFVSCQQKKVEKTELIEKVNFNKVHNFYINSINESIIYLDSLSLYKSDEKKVKQLFKKMRIAFKKAEPYAAYLNPEVGHRVNGPALPNFTDDTQRVLDPIGFQKIEETIYDGNVSRDIYLEEIKLTKGLLFVLQKNIKQRKISPKRFFTATHQQLLRIISFGITGFDTPVSGLGLEESIISLESLQFVYINSIQYLVKNKELDKTFLKKIANAIYFIKNNLNFESFDRYTFIREYINPITKNWVDIRKHIHIWEPITTSPFNFDAPTFFEENSFNVNYFLKPSERNPSANKIALGNKLFFDKKLSLRNTVSCASCHNPKKGYTDGLKTSLDNNGNASLRNSPTLLNVVFQKNFFLDGRAQTLNDQISLVFKNKQEFDSEIHQFSDRILKDTTYTKLFTEVYGGVPKKNTEVINAISSYIATLNGLNSKFDKNMNGKENSFSASEKKGLNLFMGKALCATCHFMPLTNGTVPPFYKETEREVIGVPKTAENKQIDKDLGFYWKYKEPLHKGMFKTPTVRNIAITAPYMHNGVYNTLEEVLHFYNQGGGAGLGFDIPHQTLPFDELNLSKNEIKNIIDFLNTLTDKKINTNSYLQ